MEKDKPKRERNSCFNCRHGPFWNRNMGDGGKCFVGEAYTPDDLRQKGVVCRTDYERIPTAEMEQRIQEAV